MRLVLTAAALAATFAISSANAEPTFIPGGPTQQGSLCQVSGNGGDYNYGYLTPCAPQAAPAKKKKKS
jgi:hypothetical protein